VTTVALLHGGWCWERVVPLLHERNIATIAPDLPMSDMATGARDSAEVRGATSGRRCGKCRDSAIVGPVLDAFAEDVNGRYGQAMTLMTDLIREGQQAAEIRGGDPGALAHLASVLTNEYALADVSLARSEFHAVFDGALRAPSGPPAEPTRN
jgi:hypothetical protein